LALKAVAKSDKNGYKLTIASDSKNTTLSAKTFLRHISWNSLEERISKRVGTRRTRCLEAVLPAQYLGAQEGSVNERKEKPKSDIEEVRQSESRRGKRPIDLEERKKKNRSSATWKNTFALKPRRNSRLLCVLPTEGGFAGIPRGACNLAWRSVAAVASKAWIFSARSAGGSPSQCFSECREAFRRLLSGLVLQA
jgi:hypothetical protein